MLNIWMLWNAPTLHLVQLTFHWQDFATRGGNCNFRSIVTVVTKPFCKGLFLSWVLKYTLSNGGFTNSHWENQTQTDGCSCRWIPPVGPVCFENRPRFQVLLKGLFQEGPGLGAAFSQPERAKTSVFLCSNLLIIACCPYEGLFLQICSKLVERWTMVRARRQHSSSRRQDMGSVAWWAEHATGRKKTASWN